MIQVPWGVPRRAYLTVPPEVKIVPSMMANAGLGVISKTFIPKYAWLGEYEGFTMLPGEEDYTSAYAWSVSIVNKIEKCTRIEFKNLLGENSCDILQQSTVADLHRPIFWKCPPKPSIKFYLFSYIFWGQFAHIIGW